MHGEEWPSPNKDLVYAKGENRFKHSGKRQKAHMEKRGALWVGVCPKGFDHDIAQCLLQHGIPEFRSTAAEKPYRLWNYYDGTIYAARTEDGGKTWHGFPNGHPMADPPKGILRELEKRAQEAGEERQFKNWLKMRWD